MSASVNTMPGVNIIIEGLIALFFERRNGQVVACNMGAVTRAPDHFFSLAIKKNGSDVDPGRIMDELRLDVGNITQTGISFRAPNGPIDRLTGDGDQQSFKWVLDFEGPELYGRQIGADRGQLGPVLRIEHGELFTHVVSANHFLARLPAQTQWTLVGKVATRVGVRILLDRPDSEAVFFNGDFPVEGTRVRQGDQLDILMRKAHPPEEDVMTPHPEDANHYHLAVGTYLGAGEKRIFNSTPLSLIAVGPPVSPEASCLVNGMGTTEL